MTVIIIHIGKDDLPVKGMLKKSGVDFGVYFFCLDRKKDIRVFKLKKAKVYLPWLLDSILGSKTY